MNEKVSTEIREKLEPLGVTFPDGYAEYHEESTDPYGHITWSIGNGDDFTCFDYLLLPGGYIALHSCINSETGAVIMDRDYLVVPTDQAQSMAQMLVDDAWMWVYDNQVEMTDEDVSESQEQGEDFVRCVMEKIQKTPYI